MFKNLYRLRLLDFFELTAAVGGALYIYQSGDWYDFEKPWIIGSLCVAGAVIWLVTRIGRAQPLPMLFVATYSGAIAGLADLSPWMAVLGRATVIEWANYLFDDPMMLHQRSQAIAALVTAFLMFIPGLILGLLWYVGWNGVKSYLRKEVFPLGFPERLRVFASLAFAFVVIGASGYILLRPQIRHTCTIRIPYEFADSPDKKWSQARCITGWTISSDSKQLIVLGSDGRLCEFSLAKGESLRSIRLVDADMPTKRNYLYISEGGGGRGHTDELRKWGKIWRPSKIHVWKSDIGKSFLLRYDDGCDLFDLDSGKRVDSHAIDRLRDTVEMSATPDGRFSIIADLHDGTTDGVIELKVWDWEQLSCIGGEKTTPTGFNTHAFQLGGAGPTIRATIDPRKTDARRSFQAGVFDSISGPSFGYVSPTWTDDGNWLFSFAGLCSKNSSENLLQRYANCNLHGYLDPSSGRVALFANSQGDNPWQRKLNPRAPIVEHLLAIAQESQITLVDPNTRSHVTSWLPTGILQEPDLSASKFTPDGRYLIIQDEDETADLFHIFALP